MKSKLGRLHPCSLIEIDALKADMLGVWVIGILRDLYVQGCSIDARAPRFDSEVLAKVFRR
jgi:hypothetical protein